MALAKASAVQAKGLESKITWSIEVLEYSNESVFYIYSYLFETIKVLEYQSIQLIFRLYNAV